MTRLDYVTHPYPKLCFEILASTVRFQEFQAHPQQNRDERFLKMEVVALAINARVPLNDVLALHRD